MCGRVGRIFITILKVAAWCILAITLFIVGLFMASIYNLSPERLTPIVSNIANKTLNADVTIGKVSLSGDWGKKVLCVDMDDLSVCSRDIKLLSPSVRDTLPVWGDTLLSLRHFHGGIDVPNMLAGVVDIRDVSVTRPQVNVLVVDEAVNNFSIMPVSQEKDTTTISLPDVRINRLELIDPAPIRFADLANKFDLMMNIITLRVANESAPKGYLPAYDVDFACEVMSSAFDEMGLGEVPMSMDGVLEWHYKQPYGLTMKDMRFALLSLSGHINTKVDFSDLMTIENFDLRLDPVKVNELLAIIPAKIAVSKAIPQNLDTEAVIKASAVLHRPYVIGQEGMPYAAVSIEIPDCRLKYEKADIKHLALDMDVDMKGGTPGDITINLNNLLLRGPATDLGIKGRLTSLTKDPVFDGAINGNIAIDRLPSALTSRLRATMSGDVRFDAHMHLRPSMFSREKFHNINLEGGVEVKNLYYLTYDTLTMVSIPNIKGRFGTNEVFVTRRGTVVDSLLRGTVEVDSANILVSGLDIRVGDLRLGVAANNSGASSDTTAIIPMGGRLTASSFSLFTISDTSGVKARGLNGSISMRRYKGDAHLPSFNLNLHLDRISTGNNRTRFMVSNGDLKFNISKLPVDELSRSRRVLRHYADSIMTAHPEIPVDSVYTLAKEIRARHRRTGKRVHTSLRSDSVEILEWGATHALDAFMHDWKWSGKLIAARARLYTPSFPIRNRVENLNISFSNDSVSIENMQYKAGRSDFLVSGRFRNIKDGFTSKSGRVPLKANFKLLSDTIDVNEMAGTLFAGASARDTGIDIGEMDDDALEAHLDKEMERRKDTVAPLLIPTNLDGQFDFRANHVLYSDLLLNNLSGALLLYDGAINLHQLDASSDVGAVNLNALYSAPSAKDMDFGFGMRLNDFNIKNFLKLVPAVDSIMPLMRGLSGIVNVNIAAASKIDRNMNLDLPSLQAAIRIDGDSLAFLDPDTFNKIAKWLMFKNKNRNIIDHVSAEMIVDKGEMRVYPFIFDFDRYKLGIQGYNDFALNFHYHVAVLKSPLPFKFGINISGSYDKMKVRFGGVHFNEKQVAMQVPVVNDTRINLINQIQGVFRRGVKNSDFSKVLIAPVPIAEKINLDTDTLSAADSTYLRREGLIP